MPHPRLTRIATALVATAAALLATPTHAAPPDKHALRYCTARQHPKLADRLNRDIARAVQGRKSTLSFTVWDSGTGLRCPSRPDAHYDSASTVKVTIMTATLLRAQQEGRPLTPWERYNLRLMITESDNTAATNLYDSLGMPFLQYTLRRCGMLDTFLNPGGQWGLTQVTAHDEMKQLDVYTVNDTVLSPKNQTYGLRLMNEVVPAQRWARPSALPRSRRPRQERMAPARYRGLEGPQPGHLHQPRAIRSPAGRPGAAPPRPRGQGTRTEAVPDGDPHRPGPFDVVRHRNHPADRLARPSRPQRLLRGDGRACAGVPARLRSRRGG
ncbi:serine hydrolase [Streptomyces sp. I6]|uniref:serine hydrolase n=1 Tax=Streptomyces sp. I6 TaxID=2483113 RepID=UPI000F456633|nr:hypothetical protein EBF04_29935 [Streptomyces sp. I6]